MSYQHQLVAEIWKQLQERRDVPNILREVLGQHVYDCACLQLADKSVDSIEQCMRTVVWIKCIFDLQRSYLQATHGIHDSPPEISQWLLPVDTVFTVLIQLVSVKCRLFPSVDKTPKPFLKHRIFLFQSLLSGLRLLLLLLQSEDFERERLITLRQTIENAWNGSTFTETEAFWLLELFPNTTEAAQNPYGAWMAQETIDWEYMGVPKYKEGLVSSDRVSWSSQYTDEAKSTLSLNPMKLVSEVFKALKNREATWLQTYWLLFDLLWAMESAIVQLYVEASRSDSGRFGHATTFEDTQSTLLETRKILIAAIFRIPRSEKTFSRVCVHRSLTTSLLCWQILDSGAEVSDTSMSCRLDPY